MPSVFSTLLGGAGGGFVGAAYLGMNLMGAWEIYLTHRQEVAHRTNIIPPKMAEFVSNDDFAKTQAYSRDKLKYGMYKQVFSLLENNLMLKYQVFPLLWYATESWFGLPRGSFKHCMAFSAVTDAISTVTSMPWSYYYNFVLEAKHGFNKMTLFEWIKDTLKSYLLGVCLVNPIQTIVVNWVVTKFGAAFPLYMFGALTVVMIAAMYIVPVLVMPLFNKFTPLPEDGELYKEIAKKAEELKFPLTRIYEVDGSRRSAHSNAYFYGFFNNKRIVLYDTLVKQLDTKEILAVMCHEFGHWWHNHTMSNLVIGLAQMGSVCFASREVIFNPTMYTQFGFKDGDLTPLVGFSLFSNYFLGPVFGLVGIARSFMSRSFEFQADRFAITHNLGPELRSGLIKMQKENLASVTPDWLYAACNYSHPPLPIRIEAIDEEMKKKQ